jgi:carbon-monoxide dehydrogenase large subunit
VLPYGIGTWGSRSAVMGGGAVMTATQRLRDKMTQIASAMLGVPMDQIELADGEFRFEGGALPFAQVANVAYMHTFLLPPGMEPGLVAVSTYEPSGTSPFPDPETGQINVGATYASAAAVAVVEVDRNTGKVAILDFVIVHDCGSVINPMILEGQVQGAFAQGVGAVLLEELVYDADGQPLCTTLLDYRVPSFGDVPRARIVHRETPSDLVGGFRGAGEGAIIATPAALANAIEDALRPLGVEIRQTNLAPDRLRALMRQAGASVRPLVGAGAIRE